MSGASHVPKETVIVLGIDVARGADVTALVKLLKEGEKFTVVEMLEGVQAECEIDRLTSEIAELAEPVHAMPEDPRPYWRRFERKRRPR